ncbi:unnamed protein product [Miscanthus lutarioriparius]|uniref:Ubiquitin-like protease family profile domain-containing protein n=1 Tax=Miscanthus lutarioriparius TaxID=422564 RepID=A0A811NSD7_9POAL|nr:unnamed protein product [Miscanthus lutarioriparius]
MATSAIYTDRINTNACVDEYHMSANQPVEEMRFGSAHTFELPSEGMVADSEEESMPSSPDTSSTSNYDVPGYMEQNLQHIYNSYDALVDKAGPVVLSPAFMICDKTLCLEPHLTFSLDGIKIEYLDLDSLEDEKLVPLQWDLSNIISISCKWAQSVGSALITLLVGSEAETGNAGPVRAQFSLDDLQWPRRQQKIWELGPRYQEIWKDIPSDDFALENWSIEPCLFFPRQYFSSTEDFEDVIYPQGDPDAVSISKRDVELLLPETFVNDTIIDFYIKYLSTRIESTVKRRYHFFNSFFFRKLADLDKDQGRAPEGRAAFLRVRKWTRKINVFDKDFLFIPVNFNLHWSLIVICYPGEVATFEDGDAKVSAKLPCILHMDSLKGSHTGLKDIIQSYLWEEWKERHPESASDHSDKFLNLRFVSLELPQQDNSYDCGLFLLHYVELFLTDAPSNFNPLKIDVLSGFLSDDWFPPPEASLKRSVVRKLILELVTGSFQNHPMLACGGEQLDERYQRCSNAEPEPTREFRAQRCSAGEPETVCTVDDGTHEIQSSKSICLNDSKEKGLPTSGCMLDTGSVLIVDVQNLQESEVCAPVKDTIVCLSSQDGKNEPLVSSSQLNMRSYSPEDDEVLKESNHVVTDKENEKSLFLSLDNDQKVHSQAEAEVQDIMVSTSCSISEIFAQKITSKEQSFKKSIEVGDECFIPSQDMDYVMMFDSSKDDNGPNPERMTAEGDCVDPHDDLDSVTLGDIGKNVVDNAIIEDVKSINPTAGNVNHGELYVSLQLPEGNADNGMTGVIPASSDLKEGNIEKVVAGASAHESDINANGSSELKIGNTDSGITGVSTASSDLKEENIDKVVAGDCAHESDINAKDSSELKDGNTDNSITGGSTVFRDESEGNTDQTIAGDCGNKSDLNADGQGADKYLATDSVLPCEDDTTCTDGVILSLDLPCSTKNETVSKNTSSDAELPLLDGTFELVDRPSTPKNGMSENTSFDGKRPASDRTLEENERVIPGDAKTERHYKRRKVLALEKQSSFSGATSTD